ncbi:MAG TPA: heparinase II/III family protein [Chitinophagaceae bacterium]|nr:heparinase II/III family protein [Chitinophagaceae bacterium]
MRRFFNLLGLLILSSLPIACYSQVDHLGSVSNLQPHPRILLFKGEEEAIKKTVAADTTWQKLQQAILSECDSLLSRPPVERIQIGRRLLDKSREALRRLFYLSYGYRMTLKPEYLQRAEKEMLAISGFTDWNPSHFLDVAEMTMALAIGYDWLYNELSANSKSIIKEAILKKGIEPSLDEKNNSWLRAEHNWNQVCNAGMTYGAMAIFEDQPDLSKQIINRAISSIEIPMKDYSPDGAYPEGYGYWGYGTSFNVMFLSAVEKLFGMDFGLTQIPGFLNTAGYLENMTGPSGNSFNYSDAGTGGGLQPAMFWFAARTKNPSLLWVERSRLMNSAGRSFTGSRLLPAIFLWSDGIHINSVKPPNTTMWVGKGRVPVSLMRTSWTDPDAIFVGFKGGAANVNHAHMDIGSFVMEADGVRWAMDFGMQEYESLESKGIRVFGRAQDAERWNIFRYNNLVHNTLTVNNQFQKVIGYAPITYSSPAPSFMRAVVDLTEVYNGQLAKAQRGVAIMNNSYVVVKDEIESSANQSIIRWTLLTPAEVKITGKNTAELTKNNKKLLLVVESPGKVDMKTWSTDPPKSYDAPNPGTTLVGFEFTIPANTKMEIAVSLIPEKAGKKSNKKIQPLEKWIVSEVAR